MAEQQNRQQETQGDGTNGLLHFVADESMFGVIESMNLRIPAVIPYLNSLGICWRSDLDEDDRTCYICHQDYAIDQCREPSEGQEWPVRLSCGE